MSAFETFVQSVATDIVGLQTDPESAEDSELKSIDLVMLIELISTILNSVVRVCPNNTNRMVNTIKNPGPLQKGWWNSLVHEQVVAFSPSRWKGDVRQIADTTRAKAAALSDAQLAEILAEPLNLNNVLI